MYTITSQDATRQGEREPLWTLFRVVCGLSALSWGGLALMAQLENHYVEREGRLSRVAFSDLIALAWMVPGPGGLQRRRATRACVARKGRRVGRGHCQRAALLHADDAVCDLLSHTHRARGCVADPAESLQRRAGHADRRDLVQADTCARARQTGMASRRCSAALRSLMRAVPPRMSRCSARAFARRLDQQPRAQGTAECLHRAH